MQAVFLPFTLPEGLPMCTYLCIFSKLIVTAFFAILVFLCTYLSTAKCSIQPMFTECALHVQNDVQGAGPAYLPWVSIKQAGDFQDSGFTGTLQENKQLQFNLGSGREPVKKLHVDSGGHVEILIS